MKTLSLLLVLAPSIACADSCRFEAARDLDIPRENANTLAFDLSSSDVEVEGVAGLAKIEVRGRACASTESALAEMTVEQKRDGDRIVVTAREARHQSGSWFGFGSYGLRVKVRAPADLAVKIDSKSGDARVVGVAALDFYSSSGDLVVHDVAGAVRLKLDSGDARADHLGSLVVDRVTSGDVMVRDVRGDVRVGRVGSGDVHLAGVGGSVEIESIGSGDLSLSAVEHDASIGKVGSGDVVVDGVGGNLKFAARRDDDEIRYSNVAGKVSFND